MRFTGGERAGIVWVHLCAYCAGFAPITEPDYEGGLSGRCEGCGNHSRELHRFRAFIDSVSGCSCRGGHPQAHGDLTAEAAQSLTDFVESVLRVERERDQSEPA